MTLSDLEKVISGLSPNELARFRDWFERFDSDRFDDAIARDVAAGKLDRIAEDAVTEFRAGRAKEL